MGRRSDHHPEGLVVFIDDGLSDDARHDAMTKWLAELDAQTPIDVGIRAADTLARARAEELDASPDESESDSH